MSKLTEVGILKNGLSLCLKNAIQYIKDADILFSFRSYRHALALTILSDVELGKAVIYHLLSEDLIAEDTLPSPYRSYFRERQYGLLTSETWWVGLLVASNVEYLVQNLLDLSEKNEKAAANVAESSEFAQRIAELVDKMNGENSKLKELEGQWRKSFLVDVNLHESKFRALDAVEKTLVKERISKAKQRIKIAQPFLSLSLSETPRKIAKSLLREAFQSIGPLRQKVRQFTFPTNIYYEETASCALQQLQRGVELEEATF